jgi:hypothetical protein
MTAVGGDEEPMGICWVAAVDMVMRGFWLTALDLAGAVNERAVMATDPLRDAMMVIL